MPREFISKNGAISIVHDEGQGPLVVLVSGLGGTAAFWQPVRQALARRYRVISFDQPGCGDAPVWGGVPSVSGLAQMLAEILDGAVPAIMIGHSTGGAIVQDYLSQALGPLPDAAVLSGTWAQPCPYMKALFALRLRSLKTDYSGDVAQYRAMTRLLGAAPADILSDDFAALPPQFDHDFARTQALRMQALLAFQGGALPDLPLLILGAADDRIIPAYHQQALAAANPRAHLAVLPEGGHFFPQSRSDWFIRALDDGLAASRQKSKQ
ncbi:alpha/beta fold hydrolase [Ketogulonicigenium vulgare]|uniref:alpha/beta fold hydrolase n=1 Tax=Ketogulonicigenium vulgare TaxID=92945 RepID=UPI002359939E|nr:alpha/beta hydrolase [Ketogulonicigenium vulgare]